MAGTGHPYEVINRDEVDACLDELAGSVTFQEGRDWLRSRQILKIITAPSCVICFDKKNDPQIIRRHVQDEAEANILIEKLSAGRDLRMFSRELLRYVGPNLSHLVDWLNHLPSGDPKMIRKLPRISYPAALLHAERWVSKMAREAAKSSFSGTVEVILEPYPGKVWLELLDRPALLSESSAMNHCVADYSDRLGCGTRFFSLRNHYAKSVVTVEIIESVNGSTVGQIKGHSNFAPSQEYREDIVKLLNFLNVRSELYRDAERSAITHTDQGWTAMIDVAERIDVHGFAAFQCANIVYLISPDDFQSVIASIHGPALWWKSSERCQLTVSIVGEASKHTLPEQRMLATLANDETHQVAVHGATYLVKHEGRWSTWIDSCQRWEIEGVEIHYKDGVIYLLSASGRRVVAKIARPKAEARYLEVDAPEEARRPTSSDSRRLANVMSALEVEVMAKNAIKQHGGIYKRYESATWFYLPDYAKERKTSIKKLESVDMKWVVTPWHAALTTSYGSETCVIHFSSKRVCHVRLPFRPTVALMQEICRTMNALHLIPSDGHYVFCSTSEDDPSWVAREKKDKSPHGVIYVDRRWQRIDSVDTFTELYTKLGSRRFDDPTCNETALRVLCSGDKPKLDHVIAAHLGAWSRATTLSEVRSRSNDHWLPASARNDSLRRLQLASEIFHLMSPKDQAAVMKLVRGYLKRVIGRTKRPRLPFGSEHGVRDLIVGFWKEFRNKELLRYSRWFLAGYDHLIGRAGDCVRIDPRWFEIRESLKDASVSYAIKSHLRSAFWGIKYADRKVSIEDSVDAATWIMAIETSPPESIYAESVIHVLSQVTAAIKDRSGPEWDVLIQKALELTRSYQTSAPQTKLAA